MKARKYTMNEQGEWEFTGMIDSLIFAEQPKPDYAATGKNAVDGASDDQQLFD